MSKPGSRITEITKQSVKTMALEKKSKKSRSVKYQVRSPREFHSSKQKQRAAGPTGECRVNRNKIETDFIRLTGVKQDSTLYANGLQGNQESPDT